MKKFSLLLISLFIYICAQSQEVYMYDEHGEKIYFQIIDSVKFVQFSEVKNKETLKNVMRQSGCKMEEMTPGLYKITSNQTKSKIVSLLKTKETNVSYISDMLQYKDGTVSWASNRIIIRLLPKVNIELLLKESNISIATLKMPIGIQIPIL